MRKRFIPYLVFYFIILTVACLSISLVPKGELHIILNSYHTPFLDNFFRYFTKLAEWPFYVIAAIPLFFTKYRWWTYFYASCEICNALFTTILKIIFNMPRPARFFGDTIAEQVNLVEGVNLHFNNSFPSGHTCTFFIFFTVIVLLRIFYRTNAINLQKTSNFSFDFVNILLLFVAVLGSYSRIYLSQHFLMDCFAGSILGICISYGVFLLFVQKGWAKP